MAYKANVTKNCACTSDDQQRRCAARGSGYRQTAEDLVGHPGTASCGVYAATRHEDARSIAADSGAPEIQDVHSPRPQSIGDPTTDDTANSCYPHPVDNPVEQMYEDGSRRQALTTAMPEPSREDATEGHGQLTTIVATIDLHGTDRHTAESAIRHALHNLGATLVPCQWAPDPDTIAACTDAERVDVIDLNI